MLGRGIETALGDAFFHWFHLRRYEAARALSDGKTWHGFRPEGESFRDVVTLNLETDAEDFIVDAKLCLDRGFIEHRTQGAFARDLVASFLRWVLPPEDHDSVRDFLAELGDLGPNVIRLRNSPSPAAPLEPTRLYLVFVGRTKDAEMALPGKTLRLVNLQTRDAYRDPQHDWIWVRVSLSANPPGP